MAFKLNEKVLNPKLIEKINDGLADAAFLEITLNALIYYSKNGYNHFEDTTICIEYIRGWFNMINVKSIDYGKRKLDERRNPIRRESVNEDLSYIKEIIDWVVRWKNFNGMKGFSK